MILSFEDFFSYSVLDESFPNTFSPITTKPIYDSDEMNEKSQTTNFNDEQIQSNLTTCSPSRESEEDVTSKCGKEYILELDESQLNICNILCSADLGCRLELRKIAMKLPNCEYNPHKNNGLVRRLKNSSCTISIFSSCKITCVGLKSEIESKIFMKKSAKSLRKLGYNTQFKLFQANSFCTQYKLNFQISLHSLLKIPDLNKIAKLDYDPELFPCVNILLFQPSVKFNIFVSGNVNSIGAKSFADIITAYKILLPFISKCLVI